MRNLCIRIMKNLISILLYKDYKASFLFLSSEIFMPIYFSFFLTLSLIFSENLDFSFFLLFFLYFFFLSFLFIFFFICLFSQAAYFSNKKPPQPCRDDLYMYYFISFLPAYLPGILLFL